MSAIDAKPGATHVKPVAVDVKQVVDVKAHIQAVDAIALKSAPEKTKAWCLAYNSDGSVLPIDGPGWVEMSAQIDKPLVHAASQLPIQFYCDYRAHMGDYVPKVGELGTIYKNEMDKQWFIVTQVDLVGGKICIETHSRQGPVDVEQIWMTLATLKTSRRVFFGCWMI